MNLLQLQIMKLLIIAALVICLSITIQSQPTPEMDEQTSNIVVPDPSNMVQPEIVSLPTNQINQQYLEQVQEKAIEATTQGNMKKWVADELNSANNNKMYSNLQSFAIHLKPDESFQYKWTLVHPQTKRRTFSLIISVFTYEMGDDPGSIKNPDEQNYVEVQSKSQFYGSYMPLQNIYVLKDTDVTFDKDSKFIRLTNHHEISVLVQVQMQKQTQDISTVAAGAAKNEDFAIALQKIQTIFNQYQQTMKKESRSNKWEWGFLQRQERYDEEMLKLTAFELCVILVTAIIQMYLIKNLLDKKQII